MQGPAPIPVFRPSKLTDGPEFQGSLVESPANIFYQTVKASRATLNRIQFQWRSVSDNLLVSPIVRLRFKLKISCPILWTQITAALSLQGRVGNVYAPRRRCELHVDAPLLKRGDMHRQGLMAQRVIPQVDKVALG